MTLGVVVAPNKAKMSTADVAIAGISILYTPNLSANATGSVRPSVLPALRIASYGRCKR